MIKCLQIFLNYALLVHNTFQSYDHEADKGWSLMRFQSWSQKESEKRNVTVQADDPISFMQLTAKNEMTSKEDQFQLSLLAAMGNTQRKEAADPLASKLNKVSHKALLSSMPRTTLWQ